MGGRGGLVTLLTSCQKHSLTHSLTSLTHLTHSPHSLTHSLTHTEKNLLPTHPLKLLHCHFHLKQGPTNQHSALTLSRVTTTLSLSLLLTLMISSLHSFIHSFIVIVIVIVSCTVSLSLPHSFSLSHST